MGVCVYGYLCDCGHLRVSHGVSGKGRGQLRVLAFIFHLGKSRAFLLSSAVYARPCDHTELYLGFCESNSGPHPGVASSWLNEFPP